MPQASSMLAIPAPTPIWAREPAPVAGPEEVLIGAELVTELELGGSVVLPTDVVKLDELVGTAVVPGFSVEDGVVPPEVEPVEAG
ncbi:hypothetical protein RRF57_000591 [Xylaria bambusicola]|uniref:Uncharacterized protein n=1 Tax=Xylaria bambusicola TaxID=326684 RepID=A0AAN7YUA9_9PEZI